MKLRAFGLVAAASLGLTACGGGAEANDVDVGNLSPAEITPETMGENGAMMNDMTTANDVAISNQM